MAFLFVHLIMVLAFLLATTDTTPIALKFVAVIVFFLLLELNIVHTIMAERKTREQAN